MPRPGPPIPVGATGPGLNYTDPYPLLNGALVPQTGWPCVLLDHFAPRPERVANLWVVQEWECPQELGTETWPALKVLHFDAQGHLVPCDPRLLLAQVVGRPVLILAQGNLTTPDVALGGLLWTHSWLTRHHALPPDAVLISFDWASARTSSRRVVDINEKGRRGIVGGYHLANFLQTFPPGTRVCLLGHSFGGRVILSALHLLAGGALRDRAGGTPVRLCQSCPDLHLRGVIVEAAIDHDWLDPGERLGSSLAACEALLNLYNSRSTPVRLYPLLWNSDHHRSLAHVALLPRDRQRIGPLLLERYAERDVADLINSEHTLLRLLAHPEAARCIAPYTWATPPAVPTSP
jgi:hypothetical protein